MKSLKVIFFIFAILVVSTIEAQELFYTTTADIRFFSEAPIENIEARSTEAVSVFNTETREIAFQVKINTFQFKKALMQEHFNEVLDLDSPFRGIFTWAKKTGQ